MPGLCEWRVPLAAPPPPRAPPPTLFPPSPSERSGSPSVDDGCPGDGRNKAARTFSPS